MDVIHIHADLTSAHIRALTEYLRGEHGLSPGQWRQLRAAVNLLRQSSITLRGSTLTFKAFYEEFIDRQFGDSFLQALVNPGAGEQEARRLQAEAARRIARWVQGQEFYDRRQVESRLLLTFCLYWWAAFAVGYTFEAAIFRDLRAAGVAFACHDITNWAERLSPYDLTVLGLRGDIKFSTYFLASEDLRREEIDFFITRLYDEVGARWLQVVFLLPAAWAVIDGDTKPVGWGDAASALLGAVSLHVAGTMFVLIVYEDWKARVLSRQQVGGAETNGEKDDS